LGGSRILFFCGGATSSWWAPPGVFCNDTSWLVRWRIFVSGQLADVAFQLAEFAGELFGFGSDFLTDNVVKEILVDAVFYVEAGLSGIRGVLKVGGAMELL